MTPQVGVYTEVDADADIAAHAAVLDAHTRDMFQDLRVGGGYFHSVFHNANQTQVATANRLYAIPLIVARTRTFDRLACSITTGDAGKKARLGIYKGDGANLAPNTLVVDGDEVDVGAIDRVTAIIDQQLTEGLYYLVFVTNGTPTFQAIRAYDICFSILGLNILNLREYYTGFIGAHVYAALPDPFPAPTIWTDKIPIIGARPSSRD